MNLLHDLPVDPVANAQELVAIDPVNRTRQRRGDAREQAPIVPIVGEPGAAEGDRAQAPPRRRKDANSRSS